MSEGTALKHDWCGCCLCLSTEVVGLVHCSTKKAVILLEMDILQMSVLISSKSEHTFQFIAKFNKSL